MKARRDKVFLLTFEMSGLRIVQTFIYLPRRFQRYESTLAKHYLLQNKIVPGLKLFISPLQVFISPSYISIEYIAQLVMAVRYQLVLFLCLLPVIAISVCVSVSSRTGLSQMVALYHRGNVLEHLTPGKLI